MKKTINYERDILFKTSIGEICSISLEHDFTVDDGKLKGDFIVSGEYKTNELSVNRESFNYRLPLEYELDSNIDLSTLSYDVDNFEYNVHDDELQVIIDFGVKYEETKKEPIIPEISEEEINLDDFIDDSSLREEPKKEVELVEKKEEEEDRLSDEEKSMVLDMFNDDDYITYHVHIIREGDTLESIALKYNVSVELIKEYNNKETLELKDKLIIPEIKDE